MGYNILASASAYAAGSGQVPATLDSTGANLIVVALAGGNTLGLGDSQSISWSNGTLYSNGTDRVQVYYKYAPATNSSHTFTLNTFSTFGAIKVWALSGAPPSPFESENGAASASASSLATGSVTPSADGAFAVTVFDNNSGGAGTVDSPFDANAEYSAFSGGVHYGIGFSHLIQTSAAALNPTWTTGTAKPCAATVAVFKPAANMGWLWGAYASGMMGALSVCGGGENL